MNLKSTIAAHREPDAVSILQSRQSLAEFARAIESVEFSCDLFEYTDNSSAALDNLRNAIDRLWEFYGRLEGKL